MNRYAIAVTAAFIAALGGCTQNTRLANNASAPIPPGNGAHPLYASADKVADVDRWMGRALVQIGLIPEGPHQAREQIELYCRIAQLQAKLGDREGAKNAVALAIDVSRQTPVFASSARLYVRAVNPLTGSEPRASTSTYCDLMTCTALLSEVAREPEVQGLEIMKGVANPVAFMKSGLTVTPDRDFITIGFQSPNQAEAAKLVNAIADTFIAFVSRQHYNTAAEVLKLLHKEKDKREAELASRQKAALDFRRSHGVLSFQDDKGNIVMQRLSRLSEMLTGAQLEAMDAQGTVDAVEALKNQPDKLLELARSEQKKEAEVSRPQKPSQEEVVLQKEADEKLVKSYLSKTRHRLEMAKQREMMLTRNFDEQKREAFDLNATAAEYATLESETKRCEHLVNMLADRIKDLNVGEDTQMVSINVIEVADAGDLSTQPSVNQNLAIIGQTQARVGDIAGAGATLVRIVDEGIDRDSVLAYLAAAQAKAGNKDESAKTVAQIKDKTQVRAAAELERDPADVKLNFDASLAADAASPMIQAARAGHFSNALEIAGGLPGGDRPTAYAKIAYLQATQGEVADARATFELAKNSISLPDPATRSNGFHGSPSLRTVVEAEASAGMLKDAVAIRGSSANEFEMREIAFIAGKSGKSEMLESLFEHAAGAKAKYAIAIGAVEASIGVRP